MAKSNPAVDFANLRGDLPGGQREAFEELVCQLASRQAAPTDQFVPLRSAGGDGGVECYHVNLKDELVGYQAKFHPVGTDIDWGSLDKSIATAVRTHFNLTKYVIAMPRNRTGPTTSEKGRTRKGDTKKWKELTDKWATWSVANKRHLELVYWGQDEIQLMLTKPENAGMRWYWFSQVEFSSEWFQRHLDAAIVDLDVRYSPLDHVSVDVEKYFEYLTWNESYRRKISAEFESIDASFAEVLNALNHTKAVEETALVATLESLRTLVQHTGTTIASREEESWRIDDYLAAQQRGQKVCIDLLQLLQSSAEIGGVNDPDTQQQGVIGIADTVSAVRSLYANFFRIRLVFESLDFSLARRRSALVFGESGTGKSHLLATVAKRLNKDGNPVILVLGQQLRDGPIWPQIADRLDLHGVSAEEILGALNTACQVRGVRGLLAVDAINEGAGMTRWRNEVLSFLDTVQDFPLVTCVLSCRSEFRQHLPESVHATPSINVRGFQSPEEWERACSVYMDKLDIRRPPIFWYESELTNPLFLRTVCYALYKEGRHSFPLGLMGIKRILALYLESMAKHLGVGHDGDNTLVPPTFSAVKAIAKAMAQAGQDYLPRSEASRIVGARYADYQVPSSITWLEVLEKNGLLRRDPNPESRPQDPLDIPEDVVRFSYQRYQEHLVTESMLADVSDPKAAFGLGGSLAPFVENMRSNWKWSGLLSALSTQVPERFTVEFVDVLPGGFDSWWDLLGSTPFQESLLWRLPEHISERTKELLWEIGDPTSIWNLLLAAAVTEGHPLNAEYLHRKLVGLPMTKRDSLWSAHMGRATPQGHDRIHQVIEWCGPIPEYVSNQGRELAALVLTWCFTLTNRELRDKATKALTSVLLKNPSMFAFLIEQFEGIDDLYLWERVYASAYGTCCIDPSPTRLKEYATLVYNNVFAQAVPQPNLLLRDYALGIVEVAKLNGEIDPKIDLSRCRPPYGSPIPEWNYTDEQIEEIARSAGGDQVADSCLGQVMGDFGHYEIEPAIRQFVTLPITAEPPRFESQARREFVKNVVVGDSIREAAYNKVEDLARLIPISVVYTNDAEEEIEEIETPMKAEDLEFLRQLEDAEADFLSLLNESEREHYVELLLLSPKFGNWKSEHEFDHEDARRWVAARAYQIGWTTELFPGDEVDFEGRGRREVERIGKKYQWISLSELMCRMADNYWLEDNHTDSLKRYSSPEDIGFMRDIDPTLLVDPIDLPDRQDIDAWMMAPVLNAPPTTDEESVDWPFGWSLEPSLPSIIHRLSADGREWATLYEYQTKTTKGYGLRKLAKAEEVYHDEFRVILAVIITESICENLIQEFKNKHGVDMGSWHVPQRINGPFLLESPWRSTWSQEQDGSDESPSPIYPVLSYQWESNNDMSIPEGFSTLLPSPEICRGMGLKPVAANYNQYVDAATGESKFLCTLPNDRSGAALIDQDVFDDFLAETGQVCLWTFVSERSYYPRSTRGDSLLRRRIEGYCRKTSYGTDSEAWNVDFRRDS